MGEQLGFLLVIVLVLIVLYNGSVAREEIIAGNRRWNVLRDYHNSEEAARLLQSTNAKMMRFLKFMKEKYHINETTEEISDCEDHDTMIASEPHRIAAALLDNYNPDVFYENEPGSNGTSYTLNKGAAMYICLRNKFDKNTLVDPDMLFFVMLHEAAHIANYNGWGHDTQYWEVFKFVLKNAHEAGLYHPKDYSKHPEDYCGLHVDYNPLLDKNLRVLE